jgi:hypothetical protein
VPCKGAARARPLPATGQQRPGSATVTPDACAKRNKATTKATSTLTARARAVRQQEQRMPGLRLVRGTHRLGLPARERPGAPGTACRHPQLLRVRSLDGSPQTRAMVSELYTCVFLCLRCRHGLLSCVQSRHGVSRLQRMAAGTGLRARGRFRVQPWVKLTPNPHKGEPHLASITSQALLFPCPFLCAPRACARVCPLQCVRAHHLPCLAPPGLPPALGLSSEQAVRAPVTAQSAQLHPLPPALQNGLAGWWSAGRVWRPGAADLCQS